MSTYENMVLTAGDRCVDLPTVRRSSDVIAHSGPLHLALVIENPHEANTAMIGMAGLITDLCDLLKAAYDELDTLRPAPGAATD